MKRFWNDFRKYLNYTKYAAKAQLKTELADSWLGWAWWFLDPLLFMLIYMFVFSMVFKRTTTYLVAFIFLGSTLWRFFNNTVLNSVMLVKRHRGIISKVYVPKFALVEVNMLCNTVKFICSMAIVVLVMCFYRIPLSVHIFSFIPILLLLYVLTFAVACLCMHWGVYFEDLHNVLRVFFQLLFYASGTFYPMMDTLGHSFASLLLWINPMALIINESRNALLYATPVYWPPLLVWFAIAVGVSAISLRQIYRKENQYVKLI